MPSPMRGRWHGEAVTDEEGALPFMRRCPPHQSPHGDSFPSQGKPLLRKKVTPIKISAAPSIDGNHSTETSCKLDTPASGGAYQDTRKVTPEWNDA